MNAKLTFTHRLLDDNFTKVPRSNDSINTVSDDNGYYYDPPTYRVAGEPDCSYSPIGYIYSENTSSFEFGTFDDSEYPSIPYSEVDNGKIIYVLYVKTCGPGTCGSHRLTFRSALVVNNEDGTIGFRSIQVNPIRTVEYAQDDNPGWSGDNNVVTKSVQNQDGDCVTTSQSGGTISLQHDIEVEGVNYERNKVLFVGLAGHLDLFNDEVRFNAGDNGDYIIIYTLNVDANDLTTGRLIETLVFHLGKWGQQEVDGRGGYIIIRDFPPHVSPRVKYIDRDKMDKKYDGKAVLAATAELQDIYSKLSSCANRIAQLSSIRIQKKDKL